MIKGGGSQECPNCGACNESVGHVLFECALCDSRRLDFSDNFQTVLLQMLSKPFFVVAFLIKLYFVWEKSGVCW